MFLSFFEQMSRGINSLKDKPDFIQKYGKDFMRAFREEMEYTALKAIVDKSINLNTELDRLEEKYSFNEDMKVLLSATAQCVRWAVLSIHCNLFQYSKKSKEAEDQTKSLCRSIMEQMNQSVHVYIGSQDCHQKDKMPDISLEELVDRLEKKGEINK